MSGDGQTGRGDAETQDLTRLQQTVARRMAESKATAPDFVLNVDVDMEDAVELRKQLKAAAGDQPAPSFNDFVVKASRARADGLPARERRVPRRQVRALLARQRRRRRRRQDALVVPTMFDADRKSLGQIARESRALAERVRAGKITPPELSSRHVHRLQPRHVRRSTASSPVINPPQAAILAVGAMKPTVVAHDGEVAVPHDHARSRSPATTGSSTAPTPPSSSPASASGSRTRSRSRSDAGLGARRSPPPGSARPIRAWVGAGG